MQERNKKNICIIGSGFAGLSAATHLVEEGNNVYILEKILQMEEEQENLMQRDLLLIWVLHGTGCQMLLKHILKLLKKK